MRFLGSKFCSMFSFFATRSSTDRALRSVGISTYFYLIGKYSYLGSTGEAFLCLQGGAGKLASRHDAHDVQMELREILTLGYSVIRHDG